MEGQPRDTTQTWPEPHHRSDDVSGGERLARGQAIGRYVVLEHIGDGGMGVVYSAYDPQLDRRVGLKLLRAESFVGRDRAEARLRLQREAQALARLEHPNVVSVYDAGAVDDGRVFVAMELVEGLDLRQWLRKEREEQGWRRALELFVQAGEGLEAAHRAGLLHRDFKPANVILGSDGRVRVADFGLARPAPSASDLASDSDAASGADSGIESRGSAAIDLQLTRPGQVPGTPAYMSPEQIRGLPVDERSDQFAFCVALFEALYGRLPFAGENRRELVEAMRHGRLAAPPRGAGIPAWLERAVARGLAADPQARHESMTALLAKLRRRPARRWLLAGGLAAVVAGALGVKVLGPEPCAGGADRLASVWDSPRKSALLAAFDGVAGEGPTKAYAASLGHRSSHLLDEYAGQWVEMYTESCQATRRGEQSAELLDLRTECLDRRLDEVRALTDLLIEADDGMVDRALSAVSGLGSLAACADTQALRAITPLPTDPTERQQVDSLFRLAAETRASYLLGKGDEAEARAARLAELGQDIDHAPALAEAYHARGLVARFADRQDEARQAQLEAAGWADAGGVDETRVRSLLSLVWMSEPEPARSWLRLAKGTVDRLDNPDLRSSWLQVAASLSVRQGHYDQAVTEGREAVALAREHKGPDHRATGRVLATLASAHYRLGHYDEAFEAFTEVARIRRANLSDSHPDVAYADHARGELLIRLGRYEEALDVLESAFATLVKVHGDRHTRTLTVLSSLGSLRFRLGDLGTAESELTQVVERQRELLGPDSPSVAASLNDLALVFWVRGELTDAEVRLREALEIYRRQQGDDHPDTLPLRVNLGRVALEQGRAADAESSLQLARRWAVEKLGAEHPTAINAGLALGEARIELGQLREGAELIAEAASALDRDGAEPWLLGLALFAEAHAAAALGDVDALEQALGQARRTLAESGSSARYYQALLETQSQIWRGRWGLG